MARERDENRKQRISELAAKREKERLEAEEKEKELKSQAGGNPYLMI